MTKAQRRDLEYMARDLRGVAMFETSSRVSTRIYGVLQDLGYCTIERGFSFSYAAITDAGREALKAITAIEEH